MDVMLILLTVIVLISILGLVALSIYSTYVYKLQNEKLTRALISKNLFEFDKKSDTTNEGVTKEVDENVDVTELDDDKFDKLIKNQLDNETRESDE